MHHSAFEQRLPWQSNATGCARITARLAVQIYIWLALAQLLSPAACPQRAVTAFAPAMQVKKWLTVTAMVMCLMCSQPWNWHADRLIIAHQLSSHQIATEATLQAVRAQLAIQHEATLQALQEQARLLAAHVGGSVLTEHLTAWHPTTDDPPHSEAPAVSINC